MDEASSIKVCPRCGGAWAGNLRRCLFCQEDLSATPSMTPLVHEPDMGWCVVCSATGLPLLDTKGHIRRYTEQAALNEVKRMHDKMTLANMGDVVYNARRMMDELGLDYEARKYDMERENAAVGR